MNLTQFEGFRAQEFVSRGFLRSQIDPGIALGLGLLLFRKIPGILLYLKLSPFWGFIRVSRLDSLENF